MFEVSRLSRLVLRHRTAEGEESRHSSFIHRHYARDTGAKIIIGGWLESMLTKLPVASSSSEAFFSSFLEIGIR